LLLSYFLIPTQIYRKKKSEFLKTKEIVLELCHFIKYASDPADAKLSSITKFMF